ncbi:hypothetical protein ES708_18841 [subsurface metagenome]
MKEIDKYMRERHSVLSIQFNGIIDVDLKKFG